MIDLMDYSGTCENCGAKGVTITHDSLCVRCVKNIPALYADGSCACDGESRCLTHRVQEAN